MRQVFVIDYHEDYLDLMKYHEDAYTSMESAEAYLKASGFQPTETKSGYPAFDDGKGTRAYILTLNLKD